MSTEDVFIISTGVANLASVAAMVRRAGYRPRPTDSPLDVRDADLLVLPGVGSFASGMSSLENAGLVEPLRTRIEADRPTLGICLGLQLLARSSAEAPGVTGLGVIDAEVAEIPAAPTRPQIGWNGASGPLGGDYYFANSFALSDAPGWEVTSFRYGEERVAAVQRGTIWATQFHPELSGDRGHAVFLSWVQSSTPVKDEPSLQGLGVRIIPCLDVRDGRVVKGVRFQGLRDAGDPVECAARYAADGADELVMLDVSATVEGRRAAVDTIRKVRAVCGLPLTIGGGVRSVEDAAVYLEAGADKVSVNSATIRRPQLIDELAARFGRQCTVVAVDAQRSAGGWRAVVDGGRTTTDIDVVDWVREAAQRGAGEILLTSWDRDGTGDGYDEELLAACSRAVAIPIIASGGASDPGHMCTAVDAGGSAVLAASIFHDGEWDVRTLKTELAKNGLEVRR